MIDQDYQKWADYIEKIFKINNIKPSLVLDLGCGTGNITNILAKRGYDMIGIDASVDMLNIASEKAANDNLNILYLCQDIRNFELYGTVDAVICTLDVLNYITKPDELKKVFLLVKNYLNKGGIFIFDINTEYKLKNVIGNNTFFRDEQNICYIWENEFDNNISSQYLTFFCKGENKMYQRFDEQHIQRAYKRDEIIKMLADSGLKYVSEYNCLTLEKPNKKCEKLVIVSKYFD